jgi:hypothetical protein
VPSGWLARARRLRLDVMPNDIALLSEDDLDGCVAWKVTSEESECAHCVALVN